ncbi:hypothetical protein ABMA28_013484 [Loxostege sticticalis]|uniref:Uncharacterized protein n=1 Tax=Loxostege sticticalis TaxID=481309 RepID=A0ABD0TIG8_LOXSC
MAGQDETKHNEDEVVSENDIDISDQEQVSEENMTEEYYLLDTKLDELNTALDFLERRTDDIQEKLKELLQSNISIREELKNENLKAIEK